MSPNYEVGTRIEENSGTSLAPMRTTKAVAGYIAITDPQQSMKREGHLLLDTHESI